MNHHIKKAEITTFFKSIYIVKLRITHVKNLINWHLYSSINGLFCKFFEKPSFEVFGVFTHMRCDRPLVLDHPSLCATL
jgi:hypothetical protein